MADYHYRIKDWNETFETHETRKIKRLSWLPVPIKFEHHKYRELMCNDDGAYRDDGAIVYGCFIAMAGMAATQEPKQRGNLPALPAISRTTGIKMDTLQGAINRLLQIGWLEALTENAGKISRNAPTCPERIELNRTELQELKPPIIPPSGETPSGVRKSKKAEPTQDFLDWWDFYRQSFAGDYIGRKQAAWSWWAKRIDKDFSVSDIEIASKAYVAVISKTRLQRPDYPVMHASTFIGRDMAWVDFLEDAASKQAADERKKALQLEARTKELEAERALKAERAREIEADCLDCGKKIRVLPENERICGQCMIKRVRNRRNTPQEAQK